MLAGLIGAGMNTVRGLAKSLLVTCHSVCDLFFWVVSCFFLLEKHMRGFSWGCLRLFVFVLFSGLLLGSVAGWVRTCGGLLHVVPIAGRRTQNNTSKYPSHRHPQQIRGCILFSPPCPGPPRPLRLQHVSRRPRGADHEAPKLGQGLRARPRGTFENRAVNQRGV